MDVVVGWFSLSAVRSPKSVLIMTDWKLYSQSAKRGRQWWLCSISEVNRIIEGQLQTFDWLMRGRKLSQIILIWITSSKKMKVPPSCIHTFGKVPLLALWVNAFRWRRQGERWNTWPETHGPRRVALAQGLGKASSFISGRAREKAHGKHSWICVDQSGTDTIIFFKFPQYKEYYGIFRLGQLSCDVGLTIQHVLESFVNRSLHRGLNPHPSHK